MFDELEPQSNNSPASEPEDILDPIYGAQKTAHQFSQASMQASTTASVPVPVSASAPEVVMPEGGAAKGLGIKSALAGNKLKPIARQSLESRMAISPEGVFSEEAGGQEIEISPPLLSKRGIFIIIGIILIVALGAGAALAIYRSGKNKAPSVNTPAVVNTPVSVPASVISQPEPTNEPVNVPSEVTSTESAASSTLLIDTDGDGLTDEEEAKYGTNPQKTDTDEDGLTDYEEVMIWKTDTLKADTDGDGHPDGTEVKNGYNPLGAGKLLELPIK